MHANIGKTIKSNSMMLRKGHLRQRKHPFHDNPFEAYLSGSWRAVEHIKIESGTMTLHFEDKHHMTIENANFSDVRIRSRKATLSDCNFLRPGTHISVLSASHRNHNSDEFSDNHVWIDAQINSVQRKPHNPECSCQYYINLFVNQGSLGTENRALYKEVKVVGINEIAILQKLERDSFVDKYYRWESSEDCSTVAHTKLFLGKILSDLSWLVITSVANKFSFCARSVENKIVYQILSSDASNMDSKISVVTFEDGMLMPVVRQVNSSERDTDTSGHAHDEVPSSYGVEGLRRSERRNIKPERYSVCGDVSEINVGNFRTWPYKLNKRKEDDDDENDHHELLPLAQENGIEEDGDNSEKVNEMSSCQEIVVYHRRNKKSGEANQTQPATIPLLEEGDSLALEHHPLNDEVTRRSNAYYNTPKLKRKRLGDVEDDDGFDPEREGINSNKEKRYGSRYSRRRSHDAERSYRGKSLNATAYKEMIDSYWKDVNGTSTEEEPLVKDQWKEINNFGQMKEAEIPQIEDEEQISEIDMLWREMEMALAESYLEETEDSNGASSAEITEEPNHTCPHDYRLSEEIGICCYRCGSVQVEIKYITPPFIERQRSVRHREEKQCNGKEAEANKDDDFHLFSTHAPSDELISMEHENVWSLIPQLREKLHDHQKKAFEFLWQNIGGSIESKLMDAESKKRGGCVISHAPGAGKTFLIIAFLVSYLKLFPGKKPLILAPKTTLYTWCKEFEKWEISMPVLMIHGRAGTHKASNQNSIALPGFPNPNKDVKHVLNCLETIKKWQENPSVLIMSYTAFLALMKEGSQFAHTRYMAKALREGPGILILDEGHNPRSNKSRLRKALMKVETDLRILLSGTLFQNNFCEYFNTLCLARPRFIYEVLDTLDPDYRRKSKSAEKARHLLESRARNLFLDIIAKKIDSGDDGNERMQGLNMLKEISSGFINVYETVNFDSSPGLEIYTLLMNPTDMQREILLKIKEEMDACNGYSLGLELLVTLASIHPWLVETVSCAKKFFTVDQLKLLEECKYNLKAGSKQKFVMSLVFRVMEREKVIIFSQYLAPLKLLMEFLEMFFKWRKDREILLLHGELNLFERGNVIDRFEENGGASKVLLASITACGEGISLVAASRIIFLDSEWNPSKTRQAIARAFRPGQQKMVYVYQLLATGTLEEEKYKRTTWKERISSMIFSEAFEENPLYSQADKIEDDILREMVEEDKSKSIHMILKNGKASTNSNEKRTLSET